MNQDEYWGTQAELTFLSALGTYRPQSVKTPRVVWLQRYLDAMPLREDWGKIDHGAVTKYVKAEIRKEQQRMSRRAA